MVSNLPESTKKKTASGLASFMCYQHDDSNTSVCIPTKQANGAEMMLYRLGGRKGTTLKLHSNGQNRVIKLCMINELSLMSSMIKNIGLS